ncbi:PEP/pyruvate-binding domain-containing protein [Alteribacter keqinensis]|uniref:Pyruvate, phosphate dikinase n=1 Tax=Alteribacter keqinensis TaxID=2483800 RepID=A0A3M7TPH8_9BACI|nr:PEP/pyruvate-binding domain-containing protein [Alteribacter keqinensis]RNA66927.1 pyruvate, phosphate dikinase [Alteribacter keqinensis]
MITHFSTTQKVSLNDVGGKGMNLVQMTQGGLAVPDGFIVTTKAYDQFIEENQLGDRIAAMLKGVSADDMNALEEVSYKIKLLINQAFIPEAVRSQIVEAYNGLGVPFVAVRSSATAEDLPDMSFAGQHNSYLNVTGEEKLMLSVKKCWASLWNARAISYRMMHDVPQEYKVLSLAVVVQAMVNSDSAGVMFTVNPMNNRRDQLYINSSWGMGEAVVSGIVTPDQFVLDKKTGELISSVIEKKETQMIRSNGRNVKTAVPELLQRKESLNHKELKQLFEMAQAVDRYYKQPMDTEWVIGQGAAQIVQARPVTGLHPMPVKNDDPKKYGLRFYFSFTRVAQGISEPFTPMGLEIQRLEMWAALKTVGIKVEKRPRGFKTAAGRVYWDFTELIRSPKRAEKIAENISDKDPVAGKVLTEFVERNKGELTSKRSKLPFPPKSLLVASRFALRTAGAFIQPQHAERRCITLAENHLKTMNEKALKCQTPAEKIELIDTIMESAMKVILHQCAYFLPGFKADQRARKRLWEWLGSDDYMAPVIQGLPNSPTSAMGYRLMEIAYELKMKNEKLSVTHPFIMHFLESYGHRSNVELDVGNPNWREKPDYIMNLLESYMEMDTESLHAKLNKHNDNADKAISSIVTKVKEKKGARAARQIEKDCLYMRKTLGLRERPKFDLIRSFALIRQILQEAGEELVNNGFIKEVNDVFYLERSEVRGLSVPLYELIEERKKTFYKQKKIKTVPRFMTNTGECLYESVDSSNEDGLHGVPISSGEYTGTVRVIHDPANAKLKEGEILVTHSTDPSWTPLFLTAGALIMETGGTASHGGIVAREYGLPAVSGIERVSEKLKTGDKVMINGSSGKVLLLEEANHA